MFSDLSNTSFSNEFKWRCLLYCETEKSVSTVVRICGKIIRLCDKEMLISTVLDEFNCNGNQRKAVTLLLIKLISSGKVNNNSLEYKIVFPF